MCQRLTRCSLMPVRMIRLWLLNFPSGVNAALFNSTGIHTGPLFMNLANSALYSYVSGDTAQPGAPVCDASRVYADRLLLP
jgi:hypothetical protein